MTEFFVADMHFGSASNARWRGFPSAKDMDVAIADAWCARVSTNDVVWVLGDVGCIDNLADLPGTKRLIFGNDDKPKSHYKSSGVFEACWNSQIIEADGRSLYLVHRPQDAPSGPMTVVHGHTHSKADEPDARFVSVSVDKTCWGPISLQDVVDRADARYKSDKEI